VKVICAWCGKLIREVEGDESKGPSHGICIECRDRIKKEDSSCRNSSSNSQAKPQASSGSSDSSLGSLRL